MVTNTETDFVITTPVTAIKRVSWAAVFAGVILALGLQLLLSLLGAGIGMSTVDPIQRETPSATTFGLSAGIWWAISSLVALYIGGWVAGHLAGIPRRVDGVLHGLMTWGLSTLLIFYLLGTAIGSIIGGVFNVAGGVASTAAQGIAAVAPTVANAAADKLSQSDMSWNEIKAQAQKFLSQTGKPALQPGAIKEKTDRALSSAKNAAQDAAQTPLAADGEFDSLLDKFIRQGKGVASEVDRDAVINVLVARGMSQEEATKTVANWQQTYERGKVEAEKFKAEALQKARVVADQTAGAVSKGALWGFIALLLGAIAAAMGGAIGRPRSVLS
jgi:hypothetical protein